MYLVGTHRAGGRSSSNEMQLLEEYQRGNRKKLLLKSLLSIAPHFNPHCISSLFLPYPLSNIVVLQQQVCPYDINLSHIYVSIYDINIYHIYNYRIFYWCTLHRLTTVQIASTSGTGSTGFIYLLNRYLSRIKK